ncbi:MAG TPA: hypothetical protein VFM09_01840 [Marmoricola sp.]|nr:hypothetical protein [Marmoricola sp.]
MKKTFRTAPRPLLAGALALLLLAPLTLLSLTTSSSTASPLCPTVSRTRAGTQHRQIFVNNDRHSWQLRRAVWDRVAPSPIDYPVRSDAWTKGCLYGGRVVGDVPRSWTRDQWYNAVGGRRMGGDAIRPTMTATPGNYLVIRNTFVSDYEDAFNPDAARHDATTYLDHVHAQYIRDDCVENEMVPHNLVITDTLFDGCFTAFAERPGSGHAQQNGTGPQSFTVRNSLIWVRPEPLGPLYCNADSAPRGRCVKIAPHKWLGSYGIWKWSPQAAHSVTVTDTIFRLDMPSYSSCASQEWPRGTYRNDILVWTGKGPYATAGDCQNVLPAGVRLTRDLSVWTNAKRAWLNH